MQRYTTCDCYRAQYYNLLLVLLSHRLSCLLMLDSLNQMIAPLNYCFVNTLQIISRTTNPLIYKILTHYRGGGDALKMQLILVENFTDACPI